MDTIDIIVTPLPEVDEVFRSFRKESYVKYFVFIAGLTLFVAGCALPSSPYITDCPEVACERQAVKGTLESRPADGIKIIIDTRFSLDVDRPPTQIVHQNDLLILIFPDDSRLASARLSLNDFGLQSSNVSASRLLHLAFMERFSALPEGLDARQRHVIRSIKLDAFEAGEAVQYIADNATIYFYSDSETRHKAYIVSDQHESSWSMLDFYGLTTDNVKALLTTIAPF